MNTKAEKLIYSRLKSLGLSENNINNTMQEIKNRVSSNENLSIDEQTKLFRKLKKVFKDINRKNKFSIKDQDNFARQALNTILKNVTNAIKEKRESEKLEEEKEIYNQIVNDYFVIFKKVCNHRKKEFNHLSSAKRKLQKDKRENRNLAEWIAFKDLRNYKNSVYNEKEKLGDQMQELVYRLGNLVGNRNVKNVIYDISTTKMFKDFLNKNPSCKKAMKWKNQNIGTYNGIHEYLTAGIARKDIIDKRRNYNNEMKKRNKLYKRKKRNKKVTRKIYTGNRGGQYYLKRGKKIYI